jgi:hypothetical protein
MKVVKIFHVRAPLVVHRFLGRREVSPVVATDKLATHGGATIVVEGDTDNPKFVQMRVAFCRFSDNYNKKLGIKTAKSKDPEVVPLRLLAKSLSDIERQMLLQCVPYLRQGIKEKEPNMRAYDTLLDCMQDWNWAVKPFLPTQALVKEEVKEVV